MLLWSCFGNHTEHEQPHTHASTCNRSSDGSLSKVQVRTKTKLQMTAWGNKATNLDMAKKAFTHEATPSILFQLCFGLCCLLGL